MNSSVLSAPSWDYQAPWKVSFIFRDDTYTTAVSTDVFSCPVDPLLLYGHYRIDSRDPDHHSSSQNLILGTVPDVVVVRTGQRLSPRDKSPRIHLSLPSPSEGGGGGGRGGEVVLPTSWKEIPSPLEEEGVPYLHFC